MHNASGNWRPSLVRKITLSENSFPVSRICFYEDSPTVSSPIHKRNKKLFNRTSRGGGKSSAKSTIFTKFHGYKLPMHNAHTVQRRPVAQLVQWWLPFHYLFECMHQQTHKISIFKQFWYYGLLNLKPMDRFLVHCSCGSVCIFVTTYRFSIFDQNFD